jgi:ubiquinone/menaquinone biosynthesis C-methylase UbiE
MRDRNPQARQMADASMVRTLAAQIEAIWPQERPLLARYGLLAGSRILDVGCGTGEFAARIANEIPGSDVLGVDVLESSLHYARRRHGDLGGRLRFEGGDAFSLGAADATFDLAVCRHMTQAVPQPERILAELVRVTRPRGWVHVLSEDYAMLHMMSGPLDSDELWWRGPIDYTRRTGTDARIGRRTWSILTALGLESVAVDYVIVDTLRVPRETFARIIEAWRDGYAGPLADGSPLSEEAFRRHFDEVIASLRDPRDYGVWFVPIVSGRVPRG